MSHLSCDGNLPRSGSWVFSGLSSFLSSMGLGLQTLLRDVIGFNWLSGKTLAEKHHSVQDGCHRFGLGKSRGESPPPMTKEQCQMCTPASINDRHHIAAFIPARGGSKTVPGKNLRPLLGKPLIAHTIECAQQVRRVGRIIVSTDDPEIEAVSRLYGSEVIIRPAHLATDEALVADAVRDLLDRLMCEECYCPDAALLLEPTNPLRAVADVERCLDLFDSGCYDSIATFTEAALNPHRAWVIDEGVPKPFIEGAIPWLPRQQLPQCYQLSGAVYLFRPQALLESTGPSLLVGRTGAVFVPSERSVDIDSEVDFLIVEGMMKRMGLDGWSDD